MNGYKIDRENLAADSLCIKSIFLFSYTHLEGDHYDSVTYKTTFTTIDDFLHKFPSFSATFDKNAYIF